MQRHTEDGQVRKAPQPTPRTVEGVGLPHQPQAVSDVRPSEPSPVPADTQCGSLPAQDGDHRGTPQPASASRRWDPEEPSRDQAATQAREVPCRFCQCASPGRGQRPSSSPLLRGGGGAEALTTAVMCPICLGMCPVHRASWCRCIAVGHCTLMASLSRPL
jgi:hypothetical protein